MEKDFTKVSLVLVPSMHKALKVKCAQEGVTMRDKLIGMVENYLKEK